MLWNEKWSDRKQSHGWGCEGRVGPQHFDCSCKLLFPLEPEKDAEAVVGLDVHLAPVRGGRKAPLLFETAVGGGRKAPSHKSEVHAAPAELFVGPSEHSALMTRCCCRIGGGQCHDCAAVAPAELGTLPEFVRAAVPLAHP